MNELHHIVKEVMSFVWGMLPLILYYLFERQRENTKLLVCAIEWVVMNDMQIVDTQNIQYEHARNFMSIKFHARDCSECTYACVVQKRLPFWWRFGQVYETKLVSKTSLSGEVTK